MTIYEIACLAGVSIATVSRVINKSGCVSEATKRKVEEIIAKEEYIPNAYAHSLNTKQSKTIGIICPDISDSNHAYPVAELSHLLRANGFEILLISTNTNQESKRPHFTSLIRYQAEATIVISCNTTLEEESDFQYAAGHFPVFILNGNIKGENIFCTYCDEKAAACNIVRMLAKSGRKRILYIYDSYTYSGHMKMEGYLLGMSKYAHETPLAIHIDTFDLQFMQIAVEQVSQALKNIDFEAVIAADDMLAIAVQKMLYVEKRPQVPMVGFNNSSIGIAAMPEISSVDVQIPKQCELIMNNLLEVLAGRKAPSSICLETMLHKRDSLLAFSGEWQ